ncbi:MAG: response regulator [Polyangiaceae bacterium]
MSDRRSPKPVPAPKGNPSTEPPPELAGALVTSEPFPAARPVAPDEEALEELEEIEEFEVLDAVPVPSVPSPPLTPSKARIPVSTHKDPGAPVVLVVEDDASIRAMTVRALGLSYTVFEAEDGQVALEILAQIPPPACIVSDWMMPRVDGLELAKRVRADKNLKWTPLVLLTAKSHPLEVVQGINAGARHYLAKPFKMKELLDKVASVLSGPKK